MVLFRPSNGLREQCPKLRLERDPKRRRIEPVPLSPPLFETLGAKLLCVLREKFAQVDYILQLSPRKTGVLCDLSRSVGTVAAEVEEPDRRTIDFPATIERNFSPCQIPPSDVEPRIAHDGVIEQTRNEIHPPLVDESTLLRGDDALPSESLGPPVQERLGTAADRYESEVEHPGAQNQGLGGILAVARDRDKRVRGQDNAVFASLLGKVIERRKHLDVGIEIKDHVVFIEQCSQQPRLNSRRKFGQRVDAGHSVDLGTIDADVVRREDSVVRSKQITVLGRPIEDQRRKGGTRMMLDERSGQDAGVRTVVARDDRASLHYGGGL